MPMRAFLLLYSVSSIMSFQVVGWWGGQAHQPAAGQPAGLQAAQPATGLPLASGWAAGRLAGCWLLNDELSTNLFFVSS